MKANELMIGDWVMVAHGGNATHYAKVTALLPSGAIESDLDGCGVLCKSVEPIPLTPEILEKNGFKTEDPKDGGFVLCDDYFDIFIYEWSDSIWVARYESTEMNTPVEQLVVAYVHELQHALRHFGIDKVVRV